MRSCLPAGTDMTSLAGDVIVLYDGESGEVLACEHDKEKEK